LPVFRAIDVAWAAAKYPAQATGLADAAAAGAADAAAAMATARAAADAAAFWSAVSVDATRVEEEKASASVIAGSPLWPQGQPEQLQSLWQDMKAALHAEKQDWEVWADWYDARLKGKRSNRKFEIARSLIANKTWDKGPAIVNAEIKRLIEELKPPPPEDDSKPPSPKPAAPGAPLPLPSPATRFIVHQGIVDVVPPTAWEGREAQVATYHARASNDCVEVY
jgi:hypothetical protein